MIFGPERYFSLSVRTSSDPHRQSNGPRDHDFFMSDRFSAHPKGVPPNLERFAQRTQNSLQKGAL